MVSRLNWDLLPEEFPYEDTGCEMAPSCLECPFPKCLEEEPRGKQRYSKNSRDEIMREMRRKGRSIAEIARTFDVSQRTVRRSLKATPAVVAGASTVIASLPTVIASGAKQSGGMEYENADGFQPRDCRVVPTGRDSSQ